MVKKNRRSRGLRELQDRDNPPAYPLGAVSWQS